MRARVGTVRVRTTLTAIVVVGIALAVGGIALNYSVHSTLLQEAREAVTRRANDIAEALRAGAAPEDVAVADDEMHVQIVSADDRVLAQSAGLRGALPVDVEANRLSAIQTDDKCCVLAKERVATSDGELDVIVVESLGLVDDSADAVTHLVLLGLPVLLAIVGVTTWWLAGRALAPVEAIRTEVDDITAASLDRRVAVPPGGDEITRLARTMNEMLDRLERAQRRQREFVSDASHELRSPVASIREQAEVALAYPDRVELAELAENVLAEDLRVQQLVEDMLLLARDDENVHAKRRRAVDLDDVVFDEARRLRAGANLQIDTTAVSAARVEGDELALRRVLANLGENAIRHARSRVTFTLTEVDGRAVVDVIDDGPGVPALDRERIFERFVRLDDARARDDGGSGLGLAIVAQLVAQHHGTVEVVDNGTRGARFRVSLPALPSDR